MTLICFAFPDDLKCKQGTIETNNRGSSDTSFFSGSNNCIQGWCWGEDQASKTIPDCDLFFVSIKLVGSSHHRGILQGGLVCSQNKSWGKLLWGSRGNVQPIDLRGIDDV